VKSLGHVFIYVKGKKNAWMLTLNIFGSLALVYCGRCSDLTRLLRANLGKCEVLTRVLTMNQEDGEAVMRLASGRSNCDYIFVTV
jgi:hypothetical protein